MNNLLDTFLNIELFAFIGLLVWLYFKPIDHDESDK
jgi:hypothetical protein